MSKRYRSYTPDSWTIQESPKFPQKIQDLTKSLATYFPNLTIESTPIISTQEYFIYGYTCSTKTTCECFCLKVEIEPYTLWIERIKFKYGEQCLLTGTEILQKLTNCFRELRLPKVVLFDVAKVVFQESIQISMHKFNILLYGESWYNRFGYISADYKEEKEQNAKLQNTKISPQLLSKLKKEIPNCNINLSTGITFKQLGESINAELRTNKNTCVLKLMQLLETYLDKTKKIKYNFYLEQSFLGGSVASKPK
jgi:hypothetical protein